MGQVSIRAAIAPSISLALHTNAVPSIRELAIENQSEQALADLRLTLTAEPGFVSGKAWNVSSVAAGATYHIPTLDFELDAGLLSRLEEAAPARIKLSLTHGEQELASLESELRLLARNQWSGIGHVPELICAFIQPNDPAVDRVLKKAADVLHAAGKPTALDGYATGKKARVWDLAAAIWTAVRGLQLDYALAPASFEHQGQKIRSPSQIIDSGIANCLDLTLLFTAALEQCGLNPVVVVKDGHSFPGVWLRMEEFASVVIDDPTALRKRIKLKELALFEATWATRGNGVQFSKACHAGEQLVTEAEDPKFELAVDVRRARMQHILPLSGERNDALQRGPQAEVETTELPIEETPYFEEQDEIKIPETSAGRLERWQRKLLDLSLRNALLNFRAVKRSAKLIAPDPAGLEDALSSGKEIRLLPDPSIMSGADPRDAEVHRQRHNQDAVATMAQTALQKLDVYVALDNADTDARLTELYRTAKTAMEEGGANTLHLAIGFLSWAKDGVKDGRKYRAPLILLPVQLQRKNIKSGFRLVVTDDEPRFNPTLLEMLKQDYQIRIPALEGELPKDDAGLNVTKIWELVQQAVKEIAGWEVTEECLISTFSFAKFLMWKDLVERTDQLKQNPIVKHLIETPREAYGNGLEGFPDPRELDSTRPPESIFCPLPADSSQLAATMAAAAGKDFVLVGPPGTGKSQTICNMISQCLAGGKKVLFVSEKMAALNVVYRRLTQLGLGDFCLELHSAKARKADVLEALRRAWDARGDADEQQWLKEADRLRRLRDELNTFVSRLHTIRRNGLSAFQAIGIVSAGASLPRLDLSWNSTDHHDESTLDQLREAADQLATNAEAAEVGRTSALSMVRTAYWTNAWAGSLIASAKKMVTAADGVIAAYTAFSRAAGTPSSNMNRQARAGLVTLTKALSEAAGRDWRFALAPDGGRIATQLLEGVKRIEAHSQARTALSTTYRPEATAIDLDDLKSAWNQAEASWWPKSWFAKGNVRKSLRAVLVKSKAKPQPENDIATLVDMRGLEIEIKAKSDLGQKTSGLWNGLDTNLAEATAAAGFVKSLSAGLGGVAMDADQLSEWRRTVERLLGESNDLLSSGAAVGVQIDRLARALADYEAAEAELIKCAESSPELVDEIGAGTPDAMIAAARQLIASERKLHDWCAWQTAKADAVRLGIGAIAAGIEAGFLSAKNALKVFEVSYCDWWLRGTIDGDEVLRSFVSAQHEKRIAEFKQLDDRFTDLTRSIIRARLCTGMPNPNALPKGQSEWGLLRREMEKKKRHLPLRQLISSLPTALTKLSPCLLMSPLSVAQHLSAAAALFDVVIFDEASQIPVWDAVGAMARGKQNVVVGDPKQLPPTNFFSRGEEDDDQEVDVEGDLESILDECLGANLPAISLNWHYRSRHESLIAFSNHRYYGSGLVTFPSPVTDDRAVSFHHVKDGLYEKGGSRTNVPEARAVVADVIATLKNPGYAGQTFGIVTFNAEQQKLILDLLDDERRKDVDVDRHFSDDLVEPVFVKNLEAVQGDERDYMWFSIGFGPDASGAISMNFGPMNRQGGERRLNVAVTRARHGLKIFSSIRADQIDLSRTAAIGVRDLRHFLEFAERGARAIAEANMGSIGSHESPFESAVAEALGKKGWRCLPQIGVSAFRIDLGIVDPDAPGRFLAGIECDGATYHRSATARDRDKLRERVLTDLGWKIVRIWSTDWWLDPEGTLEKTDLKLKNLMNGRTGIAV